MGKLEIVMIYKWLSDFETKKSICIKNIVFNPKYEKKSGHIGKLKIIAATLKII